MEELEGFQENQQESNFDLKAELYKYLKHWKWLLFGLIVGGVIAYLYNRYTIPQYHSESSMMIVKDQDKSVMSAIPSGNSSILSLENSTLANQIVTLRSKQMVASVVDELDHNISYYIEGNVITVEAYKSSPIILNFQTPDSILHKKSETLLITPRTDDNFLLQVEKFGYSSTHEIGEELEIAGLNFTVERRIVDGSVQEWNNPVTVKVRPLNDVVGGYIASLEIGQKGRAEDVLALSMTQESPEKSEDFLNTLMENFNEQGVADKREVAENTTAFIQERLEIITEELDSVEGGMAEFKRDNQIMDVASGASQFQSRYSAAEQQIFGLETQQQLIQSVQQRLEEEEEFSLLPSDIGISESGISGQITRYNTLVLQRNDLLNKSTEENPVIQRISQQLQSIRSNLLDNIESTKRSLNIQRNELLEREQAAQGQFSSFPGLERGIRTIERQQQIKEQLYLFLLQRREEAAISYASTSSVARVVDPAFTYANSVDPKPWLILLGGLILGLLLPLIVIFIRNFLDTKVHHKGDLNSLTQSIPFIGEVPRIAAGQSEVIETNDRSPLAESFRILRTNMAYLIQSKNKDRGEVIFVTSTIKGEGKTFISYNLARTFASTKRNVLLIGADIRNPKLHRYSGENMGHKGLSDYLYDYDVNEENIIVSSKEEDLKVDLILSGSIPPNPAELFMNDRMKNLLDFAANNYDYVILDTAPTMIVTDTLLISPLADTTIYVTRADYTEKKLLDFPKDLKRQGKLKGLAVVLNDVDYSKFSYGAKYGYSYGYGYGYGKEEESRMKKIFRNPFSKKTKK
ncbi:GumC family protein [Autumnicola musiva]|uniref:non-specific protein-tyrosine kinase n=1 Tax=Autumnicola musiva TaxID=3075589 RepID=A0ABU3D7I3_9FLAO|nr:polysaccharide biosynthesis tyrosine autokinase [Zunongwangia sp. F117]MDT0677483.1 polysaccharide biosynthesis tyrosine autokinase [Zunongwangia sp. F117]